ncbi:MAG: helix-turn-helix domain-containing protein [Pseudomonadota bacterium]|nr:helix-turn-helix domain-containing protein [Pseudomonadota bacterium]
MSCVLIDTKQLAHRLGWSEVSIVRMRCQGNGPRFIKIGRSVKYRWSDVESWLETRERQSTSEVS